MFSFLHLELTSRCNKSCWMCGRRKIEKEHPELANWGDMPIEMVEEISYQLPLPAQKIVVHFHNNGEPLLYPALYRVLSMFDKAYVIKHFDTNGKLLVEKASEIIDILDVLTISVIPPRPDPDKSKPVSIRHIESDEQYEIVRKFLEIKRDKKPRMVYRLLGNIDQDLKQKYERLPGIVATRALHDPMGSFGYEKPAPIPEYGICQELLTHLAIDRFGDISPCVRFDPERTGVLGNVKTDYLFINIWHGSARHEILEKHILGKRDKVPLCNTCEYWGIPVIS